MAGPSKVIVIGAGLCGSLLAVFLKRRGFDVELYESREDLRREEGAVHRSINLVLTSRGRYPLRELGLESEVLKLVVPVIGRAVHMETGEVTIQPYGKDESERNFSISRSGLNKYLLDRAEEAGVKIFFRHALSSVDFEKRAYTFTTPHGNVTTSAWVCFGADGAGSVTRRQLLKHLLDQPVPNLNTGMRQHSQWGGNTAIKMEVQRLGVSYKELSFPAREAKGKMDSRYLHIWPRGTHFLMGLANPDDSFTGTLYLPDDTAPKEVQGGITFEDLNTTAKGKKYIERYYPDAVPLLPHAEKEWKENPHAFLATARVSHWVWKGVVCLLGDAAHAIVPFYGQGMNASFEDVSYLVDLIDRLRITPKGGDWEKLFSMYQAVRIPAGHAIADLAIENYFEMCSKVADKEFQVRKKVENTVEQLYPAQFRSVYWMVTNTLIPYDWIRELGVINDSILTQLVQHANLGADGSVTLPDLDLVNRVIKESGLEAYKRSHGIDFLSPFKFFDAKTCLSFDTSRSKL